MTKQIAPCTKCGSTDGWWVKMNLDYDQYFYANGEASHCVDNDTSQGRRKFCYSCNHNITHLIKETND